MRYLALATDYDGTIALRGTVFPETLAALKRLLDSGRRLVLVTGRELPDLLRVFPAIEMFDRVVAENGALLYDPKTKEETVLCERPPEEFAERLRARGVHPLSAGRAIVATWTPHETTVLEVIKEMGLELQVIFNKGAVMVLPTGVNKRTGLEAALKALELSPHNVAGVGDAENDHAFLSVCECGVAVANALETLKQRADFTTKRDHGAGVEELIEMLLADDLASVAPRLERHEVLLGERLDGDGGREVRIPPYGGSVLLSGPSQSGKSTAATGLLERICGHKYQFCLVDPEGDYQNFPGAVTLGDTTHAPGIDGAMKVLANPDENLIVNLLGVPLPDRPLFFAGLLARLVELRARTGRPHWIVVDEAHHLLPSEWVPAPAAMPQGPRGFVLITNHPEKVSRAALEPVQVMVALGKEPMQVLGGFAQASGRELPFRELGFELEHGEAAVWRVGEAQAAHVRPEQGTVDRRRHTRKYAEGELPPERSFYFRGPEGKLKLRAHNLMLFAQLAEGVDEETWEFHLRKGDYARWFREYIKDEELAAEAEEAAGERDSRARILDAIHRRYTAAA